jgi:hypothetical protein
MNDPITHIFADVSSWLIGLPSNNGIPLTLAMNRESPYCVSLISCRFTDIVIILQLLRSPLALQWADLMVQYTCSLGSKDQFPKRLPP